MLGWVEYRGSGAPEPPLRTIGGARFRVVYVLQGEGLRARLSARAAARTLRRAGVRCTLFPQAYPHSGLFAARGILPPLLTPLYHATAAAIVRRYMERRGMDARNAALAFAARECSPELRRAVFELSAQTRHIALTPMSGGEELAQALRRERGVAARVVSPDEAAGVGLTVCFEPCEARGETLPLYAPALSVRYEGELATPLLAALWTAGALDAGTLRAASVEVLSVGENL